MFPSSEFRFDSRRFTRGILASAVFGALFLAAAPSQAQVSLFSDLGAGNSFDTAGGNSDRPFNENGPGAGGGSFLLVFQFTPTVTGTVASVDVGMNYSSGTPNTATLTILNDSGSSTPGTTTEFSSTVSGISATAGITTFSSASGSSLTAGTPYWVMINPSGSGIDAWYRNNTSVTGNAATSFNSGSSYSAIGMEPTAAFRVNGVGSAAAPEPGALALLLTAVPAAGGVFTARRRKLRAVA